jgi:acetylornithine/succinyldiaminopimelate/putrescine aminotransferase
MSSNPTNALSMIQRADKVLMNTYARFPIVLSKGEGAWVFDVEGIQIPGSVAGFAVNLVGHSHPRLVKAVSDQAKELIHVSNLYYNPPMIELAEGLIQNSFASKVFFCNSGAEANEGAVKLARKYFKKKGEPGRFRVITLQNSFHGRTLAMISATGKKR